MTDYERLKKIYDKIDTLIEKDVTSSDSEFETWRTKAERFLAKKYGENSRELHIFLDTDFAPMTYSSLFTHEDYVQICRDGLQNSKAVFLAYLEELQEEEQPQEITCAAKNKDLNPNEVFIVHGHDEALKQTVARLVEKQGLNAIILHEQPNKGATIIEKFERNSDVGAAVCLFTADDIGNSKDSKELNKRARQNVVFEAGYFMGLLSRNRVIILADREVELPSDMQGIVYTDSKYWEIEILKELKAMGFVIDLNKAL